MELYRVVMKEKTMGQERNQRWIEGRKWLTAPLHPLLLLSAAGRPFAALTVLANSESF